MGVISPESFFESVAVFGPYNQHFLQDIGAFQVGFGAVLLLRAVASPADAAEVGADEGETLCAALPTPTLRSARHRRTG